MRDTTGNLPLLPRIFLVYVAPIVRTAPDGERELTMARWGMPGPPQFGGAPITNIRNARSPHWRPWLRPAKRCDHQSVSDMFSDPRVGSLAFIDLPDPMANWFVLACFVSRAVAGVNTK